MFAATLPFDRAEFLARFASFNETGLLPALGIAVSLVAVAAALLAPRRPRASRVGAVALASAWFLCAGYFLVEFTSLAPSGWLFGAAFVGQALWLLAETRAGRFAFAPRRDGRGLLGAGLVATALVGYPLLGTAIGHRFPEVPVIGIAPCPTVILSLGLFLWAAPTFRRGLLAIPAAWGLVGLVAASSLGMAEDLLLFGAALVAVPVLAVRRSAAARLAPALLALGLAAVVPGSARADDQPLRIGGAGFFMGGLRSLDTSALNSSLDRAGYSRPGSSFAELGGGGQAYVGRFVLGGEGHALLPTGADSRRSGLEGRLSGGYGLARVGYTVLRSDSFVLYPLFGIGGGGVTLELDSAGRGSFDEILATNGRRATLSTGGLLLDSAVGAEWRLPLGENADGRSFAIFGLRTGWTFAPLAGDWTLSGRDVSGGPDLGVEGPYVQLLLGYGGGSF